MRLRSSRRSTPRVMLIPMIDVIFFLLVFFMLFTTFRTHESGISIDLPQTSSAQTRDAGEVIITVNNAGSMFYNGRLVSESMLQSSLREALRDDPRTMVIVRADRNAVWEYVFKAMDLARQVGASRLFFDGQYGPV